MIKLYGIKTERGTVYTTAAYEGSLLDIGELRLAFTEDELREELEAAFVCGCNLGNQVDTYAAFMEFWADRKKEIL